jgi:hypothetical protein
MTCMYIVIKSNKFFYEDSIVIADSYKAVSKKYLPFILQSSHINKRHLQKDSFFELLNN